MKFEYDYLQAKLHGIHSKSISGELLKKMARVNNIEKLHKEIFPHDQSAVPFHQLYTYVENKMKDQVKKYLIYIAQFFKNKNRLINTLILRFEMDNLKILINAHLNGIKQIDGLFEIEVENSLDYSLIYASDLSKMSHLKKILTRTRFAFLLPELEQNKNAFLLENMIDQYYYRELLLSLKNYSRYERENLFEIIKEEMNWQNITFAFRLKVYYNKVFSQVKHAFLEHEGLIPIQILEKIFELEFIPDEIALLLKRFPHKYFQIIASAFNEEGDLDLGLLEKKVSARLNHLYSHYFFKENFNILPIVSFIYLKKREYYNIVQIVESIRYNIPFESME